MRDFVFSGTALFIVSATVALSGVVSSNQIADLTHRAIGFVFSSGSLQAEAKIQPGDVVPAEEVDRILPRPYMAATQPPVAGPDPEMACAGSAADPSVIGDRLKLRVFETHRPAQPADDTAAAAMATFERLDLSGTYQIGADGTLSLPLIGRIAGYGRDLGCLEARLAAELSAGFSAALRVSVTYDTRPAVIVAGDIIAPGRYEAMTALRVADLLNLAGDPRKSAPDLQHFASLQARRNEIETALADAELRAARLRALIRGDDHLDLSQAVRDRIEAQVGADRMHLEQQALKAQFTEITESRNGNSRDLGALSRLIDERQESLKIVSDQIALLETRHADLLSLQERGLVPGSAVSQSNIDLLAVQRTLIEVRTGRAQAQVEYERLQSAESLNAARQHHQLMMELRSVSSDSTMLASQLQSIESQIRLAIGDDGRGEAAPMKVEIRRHDPKGDKVIRGDLETALLPGDLVTLKIDTIQQYARNGITATRRSDSIGTTDR